MGDMERPTVSPPLRRMSTSTTCTESVPWRRQAWRTWLLLLGCWVMVCVEQEMSFMDFGCIFHFRTIGTRTQF
jgi:hypothetical protein